MTKLKHTVKLIALVPLSIAGTAIAQVASTGPGAVTSSSVTLFGVVDAAVAWGKGDIADNTRLVSGANTSSRIGFRGVEDLGGGVGVGFWLEAGVNADDGTGTASSSNNQPISAFNPTTGANAPVRSGSQGVMFNRRSTVSLLSRFGEMRIGRDYVATFRNRDQLDPFSTNGVGANLADALKLDAVTGTRASNMIGYFLPPDLGGFFGEAQYYFGENPNNAANKNDGSGYQARLGWTGGVFGLAGAYGRTRYTTTATLGDITSWNVGGHFKLGEGALTAGYYEDKVDELVPVKAKGYLVGAQWPFGPHLLKASFSSYETDEVTTPTARKLAVGYVYNMSKRTAAYMTYAHLDNRGSSAVGLNGSINAAGKNSDGFDIGLKHSF